MISINRIKNWFRTKPLDEWEWGHINGTTARRHIRNKNVQFLLWKPGEQGHPEGYWHDYDPSWWPLFVPGDAP